MNCSNDKLTFLKLFVDELNIPKFKEYVTSLIFDIGEFYELYIRNKNITDPFPSILNSVMKLMQQVAPPGLEHALRGRLIEELTMENIPSIEQSIQQLHYVLHSSNSLSTWHQLRPILGPTTNQNDVFNNDNFMNIDPIKTPHQNPTSASEDPEDDMGYDSDLIKFNFPN